MTEKHLIKWPLMAEFVQRKVFRAAGFYVACSWVLLQFADVMDGVLRIPELTTYSAVCVVLFFPIVMITSWMVDFSRDGVTIARHAPASIRVQALSLLLLAAISATAFVRLILVPIEPANPSQPETSSTIRSIAVLKLLNLTNDPGKEYICAGLAEELMRRLFQLKDLRVASQTSSFAFHESGQSVTEIAKRLNVQTVLEGSLKQSGTATTVALKLINAQTDTMVWSKEYVLGQTDLFVIQKDILQNLETLLTSPLSEELLNDPSISIQAYENYLKAQVLVRGGSLDALAEAEKLLQNSLAFDPNFSLAHAAMCRLYLSRYLLTTEPANIPLAESACLQALENGTFLEGRLALGKLYFHTGRLPEARDEFKMAAKLDARSADAYAGLGEAAAAEGHFQLARKHILHAIELEPNSWLWRATMGFFLYQQGDFSASAKRYQEALQLQPESAVGLANLGGIQMLANEFAAAEESFKRSLVFAETDGALSNLGTLDFYQRRFESALENFIRAAEINPHESRILGNIADTYLQGLNKPALADEYYAQAVAVARQQLDVNSKNAEVMSTLAIYLARLGEVTEARALVAQALELAPDDPSTHYNTARMYVFLGNLQAALAALRRATELGFPAVVITIDPMLDPVRQGPGLEEFNGSS